MTPDAYLDSVLKKYEVLRGPNSPAERLASAVADPLRIWAAQYLNGLQFSGSYAKETGVRGTSDVDLFISLDSQKPGTLREVHEDLFNFCELQGWSPRRQNVSVGISVGGTDADLVPGRRQALSRTHHSLYVRRRSTWTQTDVALHVRMVQQSGRTREIRAIKIWRLLHGLDFPSLYLELLTIRALSGKASLSVADNVFQVLNTIGSSLTITRIEDPSNSNNVLSDDLTSQEKARIAAQARQSASEPYWRDIVW